MAAREVGEEEGRPSLHNLTIISKGRHTGKHTAALLEADIRLKGPESVAALVADNASVMKCAFKAVKSKPDLRHIILQYCSVHNLNNMMKRMFAEVGSRNSTGASRAKPSKKKTRTGGAASGAAASASVAAEVEVGDAVDDEGNGSDFDLVDIGEDGIAFDDAHSNELDGMYFSRVSSLA
jgi:hypothetical protein